MANQPSRIGRPTEMAHVGIHGLTAGDGQEGGAEHGKTDGRFRVDEVAQRAERAKRSQDGGCTKNPEEAEDADDGEPQQHRWPENLADETGALALNKEQSDQDQNADRHDEPCQLWRVDFQSFHRAQHGDRRRDDTIAVQQRRADQSYDEEGGAAGSWRRMPGIEKRQKRHNASFAVIVGAHDENSVLHGDDHDQRPEDQRHDARDRLGRQCSAGCGRLLERIKWARADIAVDDAQRGQCRRERNARSLISQ